jgi:23S rRNA maturation-related 3'-5' exoribonuclease YhaM
MDIDKRKNIFEKELTLIKNNQIRDFTEKTLELLPDYFFTIPASTTRKYHPQFAAGEGGLVRHTQAAVRLANEWFRLEMFDYFSDIEKDLILSSLLLHDGMKAGTIGLHTVSNHPLLMGEFINKNKDIKNLLPENWIKIIIGNIEHHMGQWTKDYKTKEEILEKPKGKMQNFVHLCDYTISRKLIEVNLKEDLSG